MEKAKYLDLGMTLKGTVKAKSKINTENQRLILNYVLNYYFAVSELFG